MMRLTRLQKILISLCLLMLSISGCATKTTVVLVPDPDGKLGSAVVANSGGSITLTQANEATTVGAPSENPARPRLLDKEEIDSRFGAALAIQPARPEHFLLYFQHQSTELEEESGQRLAAAVAAITKRQSRYISVIGHADTSGDREYNLTLSRKRAEAVQELLVARGIDAQCIQTTSHGEEDPLIKTGDNTAEPRNRRVEIVVR